MDHRSIIDLWPSLRSFAEDIGVAYGTAKAMRRRNSVPAEYWQLAIERAGQRGLGGVTLDVLTRGVPGARSHELPPVAAETPSTAADAAAPPSADAWRLPLPPRGAHIWEIFPHGLTGPVTPIGEKLRLEVWATLPDPADRLVVVHDSCGLLEIALKPAEASHLARLLDGEPDESSSQPPPGSGDAPLTLGIGPKLVGHERQPGFIAKSLAALAARVSAYRRRRHARPLPPPASRALFPAKVGERADSGVSPSGVRGREGLSPPHPARRCAASPPSPTRGEGSSAHPFLGTRPRLPGSAAEADAIAGAPRGRFLPELGRGLSAGPGRFLRGGAG